MSDCLQRRGERLVALPRRERLAAMPADRLVERPGPPVMQQPAARVADADERRGAPFAGPGIALRRAV